MNRKKITRIICSAMMVACLVSTTSVLASEGPKKTTIKVSVGKKEEIKKYWNNMLKEHDEYRKSIVEQMEEAKKQWAEERTSIENEKKKIEEEFKKCTAEAKKLLKDMSEEKNNAIKDFENMLKDIDRAKKDIEDNLKGLVSEDEYKRLIQEQIDARRYVEEQLAAAKEACEQNEKEAKEQLQKIEDYQNSSIERLNKELERMDRENDATRKEHENLLKEHDKIRERLVKQMEQELASEDETDEPEDTPGEPGDNPDEPGDNPEEPGEGIGEPGDTPEDPGDTPDDPEPENVEIVKVTTEDILNKMTADKLKKQLDVIVYKSYIAKKDAEGCMKNFQDMKAYQKNGELSKAKKEADKIVEIINYYVSFQ